LFNLYVTGSAPRSAVCLSVTYRLSETSTHCASIELSPCACLTCRHPTLVQDQRQCWRQCRISGTAHGNRRRRLPDTEAARLVKSRCHNLRPFRAMRSDGARPQTRLSLWSPPIDREEAYTTSDLSLWRLTPAVRMALSVSPSGAYRSALASWTVASTTPELS